MKKFRSFKDKTHYGIDNRISKKWSQSRNTLKDLYKSEKHFFFRLLKNTNSYLDVGCAGGGFFKIISRFKKKFIYFGLDVSPSLIKIARKNFKKGFFYNYDGKRIKIPKKVDMAYSFGTLHHVNNYLSLIKQMINVSNKYILFDLRLTKKSTIINKKKSFQKIEINNKILSRINYNIINKNDFLKSLKRLTGKYKVRIYQYYHNVNKSVVTKHRRVIMAVILIDKSVINK
jgi:SAM-dependent methyltransferase